MTAFLKYLAHLANTHSKAVLITVLLLCLLSLAVIANGLQFDTNQDNLIAKDQHYLKDYEEFLKKFGDWEYIYVVFRTNNGKDVGSAQAAADELEQILKKEAASSFEEILVRHDVPFLKPLLLALGDRQTFEKTLETLKEHKILLREFLGIQSVNDWYVWLNHVLDQKSILQSEKFQNQFGEIFKDALIAPFDDDAHERLYRQDLFALLSNNEFNTDGYLITQNQNLLFVRLLPVKSYDEMEIIKEPLQQIKSAIAQIKTKYPMLDIGLTGRPVLQNDEATSTSEDGEMAGMLSAALVALLIFLGFGSFRKPLFALMALFAGIIITTGIVTLTIGTINLITMVFAIILIGLGIDYGIHYLLRYNQERATESCQKAIETTSSDTGRAIIVGAITSAIAFGTALFTNFLGLQQLGIIAAIGIVICCLAQLIVLPALLRVFDKKALTAKAQRDRVAPWIIASHDRKIALPLIVLLTLAALPFVRQTGFSFNLLELQDPNLESVRYENIIQSESEWSTWFLVGTTRDKSQLSEWQQKISALPSVKKTVSLLDIIPIDLPERLQKLKPITDTISIENPLHLPKQTLSQSKQQILEKLKIFQNQALQAGEADGVMELDAIIKALNKQAFTQDALNHSGLEFSHSTGHWQYDLHTLFSPIEDLNESDLPRSLTTTLKSADGTYALSIYPKEDIWDPDNLEAFLTQVREIIPGVTGAPVTTHESAKQMINGFVLIGALTSIIVLVFLFVYFKSIAPTALVFSAVLLAFLWLLGFMGAFGLTINLANFFALPILIGSGIDHGVHVMHHLHHCQNIRSALSKTAKAITLSSGTTILGFGSLAFVRHQGLASFGLIMAAGTAFVLIATIFYLPFIVMILQKKGQVRKAQR